MPRIFAPLLFLFLCFVATPALNVAFAANQGEYDFVPQLTAPVTDEAGLLSDSDTRELNDLLFKMESTGKAQMAIFIPRSLHDRDIESFAVAVFEKWKLGKKGQDNGLLLVVAPNERKMRIEVGYGLEGDITDAFSKQVLDDYLAPYFRQSQYGAGLAVAVKVLGQKIGIDLGSVPAPKKRQKSALTTIPLFHLIFLAFVILSILSGLMGNRFGGRRRYYGGWGGGGFGGGSGWGGGGGFGGGFGGGGGSSGGGGASSSW